MKLIVNEILVRGRRVVNYIITNRNKHIEYIELRL